MDNESRFVAKIIGGVALFVALIVMVFFGPWYTIDQGERGVVVRLGQVVGVADAGLHWRAPFITSVPRFSVQAHKKTYDKLEAYSRDQQPTEFRLSINYQLAADQVDAIYAMYGSAENLIARLVDPKVNEQSKNVFGQFNAITAVQERARLNAEIERAIRDAVTGPVVILSVQVENIDFSTAYEQSVEARMLAEVEVERIRQNLAREQIQADIARTQAQGRADATLAQAKADGEAIRIRGLAEADAITARAKALADNPALVALVQAERWDGKLPTTMLPDAGVPMLAIK